MKRTIAVKLHGTPAHIRALRELQATFAAACNTVAAIAVEARTTNRVKLHHLAYYQIRARFPALGAQMTCNAIASVARSVKAHRGNGRPWQTIVFRGDGAVHFLALRRRLQGNGSQSAKQLLRKVSGRESRHARHVNHTISAKIVAETLERGCGTIAMENLRNIRNRIKAGKRMRTTSQTCANCDQRGARQRHRFSRKPCGIFAHSDRNAARNIAKIAARALTATGDVMRPYVAA